MKIHLKTIVSTEFQVAIKALGEDSIAVTDRFRLAQTFPVIVQACASFDEARQALFQQFGDKESVLIAKRLAVLEAEPIKSPEAAGLAKRKAQLDAGEGEPDRYAIDNNNAEARKGFETELNRLLAEEVELPLKAKIKLRENSKLTASQMTALLDIIEVAEG